MIQETLPKTLRAVAKTYPQTPAQYAKNAQGEFFPILYKDLYKIATDFARALLDIGVTRGQNIGLISDNRKEWVQADFGIMSIGAVDVPRGCDATQNDLEYILGFSECRFVIAENPYQVKKILNLKAMLPLLSTFIVFDPPDDTTTQEVQKAGLKLFDFETLVRKGAALNLYDSQKIEKEIDAGKTDDTMAIIFTSGTTGTPKGVMLTHKNFLAQLVDLNIRIKMLPGEKAICVLPIWHVFQRLCEYVVINQAGSLCYSKPVASILLADFLKVNPQMIPAVPRVFEALYDGIFRTIRKTGGITAVLFFFFLSVAKLHSKIERKLFCKTVRFHYDFVPFLWPFLVWPWLLLFPLKLLGSALVFSKIRAKLGKCFRLGVSGGGALPPKVAEFFWAIGVNVYEGYGLTETAPVVSVQFGKKMYGSVGTALKGIQVRVVDDKKKPLPLCKKGVLQVKGPTVMKGYYKQPDLTAKVIDKDGWFDTGDIAKIALHGEIVLKGRKKDTIVLRGGENIEPAPMEMKLTESRYIDTAVVVGQDQRYLGVLILPCQQELEGFANENNIQYKDFDDLCHTQKVNDLIASEIKTLISAKTGFKMYEKINKFAILSRPFEVGRELSAKQEIMRYKIPSIYAKVLKKMFK